MKIIKQIFQLPLQYHSSPLTKLFMEIEHQHFMETKQQWFLLSSFAFVDVEIVPLLRVKKANFSLQGNNAEHCISIT